MLSTKTLKRATGLLLGASFAPLAFAGGGYGAPAYTPDLLPSNPSAGMCYARVEIPAQFTTTQEDVLVEEGYTTIEVSQATARHSPRTYYDKRSVCALRSAPTVFPFCYGTHHDPSRL